MQMISRSSLYLPSWDDVLSALRGGEYTQARGGLCYVPDEAILSPDRTVISIEKCWMCPLGIIAWLSGQVWELRGDDNWASNDDGETAVPQKELLEHLGLNTVHNVYRIRGVSKEMAEDMARWYGTDEIFRWEHIAYLNDIVGLTLEEIADELEHLGWTT